MEIDKMKEERLNRVAGFICKEVFQRSQGMIDVSLCSLHGTSHHARPAHNAAGTFHYSPELPGPASRRASERRWFWDFLVCARDFPGAGRVSIDKAGLEQSEPPAFGAG